MANADYQVTITMTPETVTKLDNGNYTLYGFTAVQSSDDAGRPLVWFKRDTYSTSTIVGWQAQYQAYTSHNPIIANRQIVPGFSININRGQTLKVVAGGTGTVVSEGPSTAISIYNTTQSEFTCGISEVVGGTDQPLCAFPLYGSQMDYITPLQKLLLMFSTNQIKTGTVINYMYGYNYLTTQSPGIFIDLASANERAVNFHINEGWSWGGSVWAIQIPPNADLVPLLIEDGDS